MLVNNDIKPRNTPHSLEMKIWKSSRLLIDLVFEMWHCQSICQSVTLPETGTGNATRCIQEFPQVCASSNWCFLPGNKMINLHLIWHCYIGRNWPGSPGCQVTCRYSLFMDHESNMCEGSTHTHTHTRSIYSYRYICQPCSDLLKIESLLWSQVIIAIYSTYRYHTSAIVKWDTWKTWSVSV